MLSACVSGEAPNIAVHEDAESEITRAADTLIRAVGTSRAAGAAGEESGADAVLDSMKLRRMSELQEKLTAVAVAERWPFHIEPPGSGAVTDDNSVKGGPDDTGALTDQQALDWQQLLQANETLKSDLSSCPSDTLLHGAQRTSQTTDCIGDRLHRPC